MAIVIMPLNHVLPDIENRFLLVFEVVIMGVIGALIYFRFLYKNNGLYQIFGKEQIDNILRKFHLKKSQ